MLPRRTARQWRGKKVHGMCCSPLVHAHGFLLEAAFSSERQVLT